MADSTIPLFIDASVFVAAAGSPSGGSSLVLEICRGRRFHAISTRQVLLEAQVNIRSKMPPAALVRFYQLLGDVGPGMVAPVSLLEEARYKELVGDKDAHVIAAAVKGQAVFLLSLDRKHLVNDRVRAANLPLSTLTPGDFLHGLAGSESASR